MNRLKTEEQSARVIEQLGQTISRIDYDKQKNRSGSNPNNSLSMLRKSAVENAAAKMAIALLRGSHPFQRIIRKMLENMNFNNE